MNWASALGCDPSSEGLAKGTNFPMYDQEGNTVWRTGTCVVYFKRNGDSDWSKGQYDQYNEYAGKEMVPVHYSV